MDKKMLWKINRLAAEFFHKTLFSKDGKPGLDYFRERNLSNLTIRKFGLGYTGKYKSLYRYLKSLGYSDLQLEEAGLIKVENGHVRERFWNRVMYPIMDTDRHVIGFGGRVLDDGKPKYLNSPETSVFDKSRNLYGFHLAKNSEENALILCEGYMDVIAMHQAGFSNAVASLGTALTENHASLIRNQVYNVYLIYDSDDAGIKAALRAIPMLEQRGVASKVVHLEPYKDPDEFIKALGADAFQTRINGAEDGLLFQLAHSCETREELISGAVTKLLQLDEQIQRTDYLFALAKSYDVHPNSIKKVLSTQLNH